ncbi:MAG: 4'-phosphopantetheinyl transferase superfamily protein [Desulfobulbaceae bacterium]|jgi:4'-phosphopantetheinyl transferase|nr:4'-phosphopantetheinyl transferase superfamily protein [Desulfobulbaceae bacterium]
MKKISQKNSMNVMDESVKNPEVLVSAPQVPLPGNCPVQLWSLRLDQEASHENDLFDAFLSPEERRESARFEHPHLAARYRLTHVWMRQMLARQLGRSANDVVIVRGKSGKPRLRPDHLNRPDFNLSHTDALALLAMRNDGAVGVDVETIRPTPEAFAITTRWFSTAERRWLHNAADHDRAFLRLWVCREAFLKATGDGFHRPLDSFSLRPDGDVLRMDGASLIEFAPTPGHVAAIALV